MKQVDYIIVGQGIAGSFLSWYLIQQGKKVILIDDAQPFTASRVASGVINPVTGRRIVNTWMIDTLLPFALDAYTRFGNDLQTSLISQTNILDFHPSPQMKLAFAERLQEENKYLRVPDNEVALQQYFNLSFGIGEINPCYLIEVNLLITEWRKQLIAQQSLLEETFDMGLFMQTNAITNYSSIEYKNYRADKIIFSDGANGADNPFFKLLPYAKNKGQAVIVDIPNLPRNNIYKQGLSLVPWKDNLWWVGSTYEWNFTHLLPSPDFREKVEQQLNSWLKLPYAVVDHIASERPANLERRPFVGLHPVYPTIGILNGMGTKGCSLSPYFALELANHLTTNSPINPTADVQRFKKILSR